MSHSRSRSDPNFAVLYERSDQEKMASFTPRPNARSSNHTHHRSPSDPALNLINDSELEMPLVDIESSNEPIPHWNPFSPYYESNKLDFVANPSDVTDDDFASLRESQVEIPKGGASYYPGMDQDHLNAGYPHPNVDHYQPNAGNLPTSEFQQGAPTDIFGSTTFGSQVSELQQCLRSSSENLDLLGAPDSNRIDPQQQVTQIVQDGNNPFLEGYRTTETEHHLNLADQASSDSEPEENYAPDNSGLNPPLSPGLADPFGAAPFIVQKSKQAPPPAKDAFGSSPFAAPHPSQSKGGDNQLNDVQRSEQLTDSFGLPSSFTSTQERSVVGNASAIAPTPFHEVSEDSRNSTPFVGNVTEHEDPSGLVNPAADFIDNTEDPFGGVSFKANPAVKRRNAKKQQGIRKEPPVAAPRGDQGPRPRPRRLLPQTPDKAPGVSHAGQRIVSGQTRVQGARGPSVASTQGPEKSDPKSTGNRSAYAAT